MIQFIDGFNLGVVRSDSIHYFPVRAVDSTSTLGVVTYRTSGTTSATSLPMALTLDTGSGYIYGYIPPQSDYQQRYRLNVTATKIVTTNTTISDVGTFTLAIIHNDPDIITWKSSSTLTINDGLISDLKLESTHTKTAYNLNYNLVGNNTLPAGLSLNTSTGNIVGFTTASGTYTITVVAWSDYYNIPNIDPGYSTSTYIDQVLIDAGSSTSTEYNDNFNVGGGTSTFVTPKFDKNLTGTTFSYAFSTQTVTLKVVDVAKDYAEIYICPYLKTDQRDLFTNFITSSSVFVPESIYRADDPNFGVKTDFKVNLEFGIERINLTDYTAALRENFYRRRLTFGDFKVARGQDSNNNHIYDVVYVDIIDDIDGVSNVIYSDYSDIFYPASVENMRKRLETIILPNDTYISVDEYHLPKFMRTAQAGTYLPTNYIKVLILCYALPGEGNKILRKIKSSKFDFKRLNFEIDRIIVQNSLDNASAKYLVFPRQTINDTLPDDNIIYTSTGTYILANDGNPLTRD
jgi:hypothetical protein